MCFGDIVILPDTQRVVAVATTLNDAFVLDGEAIREGEPLLAAKCRPFVKERRGSGTINNGSKSAA